LGAFLFVLSALVWGFEPATGLAVGPNRHGQICSRQGL
jgi:hypothetical protein